MSRHTRMDHFFWTARFYLALRFDVLGSLAIYVVTLAALGGAVSQGDAAFAIVLTYQFVGGLHETFYSYAKLELDVNSELDESEQASSSSRTN